MGKEHRRDEMGEEEKAETEKEMVRWHH